MDLGNVPGTPWFITAGIAILSVVLTYLGTRKSSEEKVETTLIQQTVERQQQLDNRQLKMMDDMQEEANRVRDEMRLLREELNTERNNASELRSKIADLENFNQFLQKENAKLTQDLADVRLQVQTLIEENTELRKANQKLLDNQA